MPASDGPDGVLLTDGQLSFDAGVNSLVPATVATPANPGGLARNALSWLINGTVRDNGITQRTGWIQKGIIAPGGQLYQGGFMYEPDAGYPYPVVSIGGQIYQIDPDFVTGPINLTALFSGTQNPPNIAQAFFAQGEKYLVIQAGDYGLASGNTLPLFWDGTTLRRSKGITNRAVGPGTPGVNELPAGTAMVYYQGRMWYVNARQVSAGDIVGGNSGTAANNFRDAILNVTENPLVLGGDGFTVPTNSGNITAVAFAAQLDATLGQSNLYIFTRKAVYALQVPVTRANWIAATSQNQPLLTVVQLGNGSVNDRSIVSVNGDLYFQSLEPGVRSLIAALRYFGQYANPPVSNNEGRILAYNNRALMNFASGIYFDNRMWQTILPQQSDVGVIHKAVMPLDFTPLSEFASQDPPAWEGSYEGLDVLQLFYGDFGGLERAFAVVRNGDGSIALWELTTDQRFENGDNRVNWQIEFPAYNAGKEFDLKRLVAAELWIDKLFGNVTFTMQYRVDGDPCLYFWHQWQECAARTCLESGQPCASYPAQSYRESFQSTMTLPRPPAKCEKIMARPSNVGYQFQPVLTIKGWCRVRGILLHMESVDRQLYKNSVCSSISTGANAATLPISLVTLSASNYAPFAGQNVFLTANVSLSTGLPPVGTVTFFADGTPIGSVAINGSAAVLQTSFSVPGSHHAVWAVFNGNGQQGTSNVISINVGNATTAINLSANTLTPTVGQQVTLTGSVMLSSGATATGSVNFYINNALAGNVALSNGQASFQTTFNSVGTDTAYAVYVPGNGQSVQSNTLTFNVSGPPLTNLWAWYDASVDFASTPNGTAVTKWNDISGNGRNANQSSDFPPTVSSPGINGKPTVSFQFQGGGSSPGQSLVTSVVGPAYPISIFAVIKNTTNNNGVQPIVGTQGGGEPLLYYMTQGGANYLDWSNAFNDFQTGHGTFPLNTAALVELINDGVNPPSIFLNGTNLPGGNQSGGSGLNVGNVRLGGYSTTSTLSTLSLGGLIAEVLIYNQAVGATERQQIENYLIAKWGLP